MLLSELHFWTTLRDEVRIKSSDLGAFRYQRQREVSQELTALAKRDYTERRNGLAVLKNSRKSAGRLKDNLKKLEDLLRTHKLVHSEWQDAAQVLLLFDHGIMAHICVDIYTGDILRMVFEKYLVGKLAAEVITDGECACSVGEICIYNNLSHFPTTTNTTHTHTHTSTWDNNYWCNNTFHMQLL